MPEAIFSLWSPEIQPTRLPPQSPLDVLAGQAQALTHQTAGILKGEVSQESNDEATAIDLDMIVPAMGGFRRRVLTATHPKGRGYPVWIYAACFPWSRSIPPFTVLSPEQEKAENVAANDAEFRKLVEKVLHSDEVKSVAQSLIAHVNDGLGRRNEDPGRKDSA
jgi:hypothetical protein